MHQGVQLALPEDCESEQKKPAWIVLKTLQGLRLDIFSIRKPLFYEKNPLEFENKNYFALHNNRRTVIT